MYVNFKIASPQNKKGQSHDINASQPYFWRLFSNLFRQLSWHFFWQFFIKFMFCYYFDETKPNKNCFFLPDSWNPGTPESTAMTVNLSPRLVLIKSGIVCALGTALSTRVCLLTKFTPSSVVFALQLPGLGSGVSTLDMGNQFEFNADCPLNGPCSKLLNKED